ADRRAQHLRRDPARRAGDPPAQDGCHLLVLPLHGHGVGPHLPARREGPAAGIGHAAARVACARQARAAGVLAARGARNPARLLRRALAMEWWLWPLALFALTFAMGIVAVLAGIGGGVLFVPI